MRKGILVVSFGTTYPVVREKCIGAVEQKIKETFLQWEVRRAFSSNIVIKRIFEKEGIRIDNPRQALEKFREEGFEKVIVQPLHILAGEEYEKVVDIVKEFKSGFKSIAIGKPLLYFDEDYIKVVDAFKNKIPPLLPGEKVILMGHGTRHRADESYARLETVFRQFGIPVYIGTVEGKTRLESIISILKQEGVNRVLLMPFMLVSGEHVVNDMVGADDSWKAVLESEGFKVRVDLRSMGEDPYIQNIFVDHVDKNINY